MTFFACAVALERNPRGGRVAPRGWPRALLSRLALGGDVALSPGGGRSTSGWPSRSIRETTGERPHGWYCRYGPSVHTRELLVEEGGFVYDSDAYNDDLPYYSRSRASAQLIIPYSMTYNDGKFSLPPSIGRRPTFSTSASAAWTTSGTRARRTRR